MFVQEMVFALLMINVYALQTIQDLIVNCLTASVSYIQMQKYALGMVFVWLQTRVTVMQITMESPAM